MLWNWWDVQGSNPRISSYELDALSNWANVPWNRDGGARTLGFLVPNQARYQLRYISK